MSPFHGVFQRQRDAAKIVGRHSACYLMTTGPGLAVNGIWDGNSLYYPFDFFILMKPFALP